MKKLYLLTLISFLGYLGCADLLYKEKEPIHLWGESYSIDKTTRLILSGNELSGPIPPEIGNLINLTTLDLSNNQLSGDIPIEIGNFINLTTLDLSNNQLSGDIPIEIGNLTNLKDLDLRYNQLTGIIPDEICNQGDASPELGNNQFCDPYPICMGDNIETQDAYNCSYELWGETYLVGNTHTLILNGNGLSGSIPCQRLEILSILRI